LRTDWALLTEQMVTRCGGHCERCGWPLPLSWVRHHRKLRKHGGRDELANLVALCDRPCHNLHRSSVHANPTTSLAEGFLVSQFGDPASTPLLLHRRRPVLLGETYTEVAAA